MWLESFKTVLSLFGEDICIAAYYGISRISRNSYPSYFLVNIFIGDDTYMHHSSGHCCPRCFDTRSCSRVAYVPGILLTCASTIFFWIWTLSLFQRTHPALESLMPLSLRANVDKYPWPDSYGSNILNIIVHQE